MYTCLIVEQLLTIHYIPDTVLGSLYLSHLNHPTTLQGKW